MTETWFEPTLARIAKARAAIQSHLIETPVLSLHHRAIASALGPNAHLKLELFQHAGSFKARGVFLAIQALDQAQRRRGVVAVSAGNHAIATAWGAKAVGVEAVVCLPKTADPYRVGLCQDLGASVVMGEDIADAIAQMQRIAQDQGRVMLHPFESPFMTLGAATCAAEYLAQAPDLEVAIVPVGGGGFISGVAAALKQLKPSIQVIGVEPMGADVIARSLANNAAPTSMTVSSIADSLGAPMSLSYSLGLIERHVDRMVTIDDDSMRQAMGLMRDTLSLLPEPACAASLAAAMGPLRAECHGTALGLFACGSNIGLTRWQHLVYSTCAEAPNS